MMKPGWLVQVDNFTALLAQHCHSIKGRVDLCVVDGHLSFVFSSCTLAQRVVAVNERQGQTNILSAAVVSKFQRFFKVVKQKHQFCINYVALLTTIPVTIRFLLGLSGKTWGKMVFTRLENKCFKVDYASFQTFER